jgi:hypothetical protein
MPNRFSITPQKSIPLDSESLEKSYVPSPDDVTNQYNPFWITGLQAYNPIHGALLDLNVENYNVSALNHNYHIVDMNSVTNRETGETVSKNVFIKFSPLLDPVRYMIGKYKADDKIVRILPKLASSYSSDDTLPHPKLLDTNNASYTDNFFSFLTSKLATNAGFLHGLDYYGSFVGVQDKYKMNVADDLEYLNTSTFFVENQNKLFTLTENVTSEFPNVGSRANKNKIQISDSHNITNFSVEDLVEPSDLDASAQEPIEELVYEKNESKQSTQSSNNSSSNNSETNYSSESESGSDSGSENGSEGWETEDESESDDSSDSEPQIFAYIHNFPVQLICLEKCDGTIDRLFMKDEIDVDTGASALFQIVMTLLAYKRAFHFTHNDLHTNNIMYVNTDIEFLFYKFEGKTYKVPTYGKIFKLIDFGRSIYKFGGKIFCSDSFAPGGDAATQYNCEPYLNEDKPRLDPNYSFDLCRLGCSIYDFIIEDDDTSSMNELQKTIHRWCLDDADKNVLYKRNGDERYPNFKLYKMIARTVHKHTPEAQLEFDFFKQFLSLELSGSSESVMDLDAIPCYV